VDPRQRLECLLDDADLRDSALAEFCREPAESNARLTAAVGEAHTLSGFVAICSRCKKVRDDGGF